MTIRRDNYDPQLITALAAGRSVSAAAAVAGISRVTAYKRLQDPEIKQQIQVRRASLTEQVVDKLIDGAAPACARLTELVDSAKSENVQLSAARTILDRMVKMRSLHDLEDQVRELLALLTQQPQETQNGYWPDSVEKGPPCLDGLDIQEGYRHIANWMDYLIYKGGLTEEKVQELKSETTQLREAARRYDEAIAS